jgi:RNA polymerase-binding transcription factor DksA
LGKEERVNDLFIVREDARVKIRGLKILFQKLKHPLSQGTLNELESFEEALDGEDDLIKIYLGLDEILLKLRPLYTKLKEEEKHRAREIKLERSLGQSSDVCMNCKSQIELTQLEKHPKTKLCINCNAIKNNKIFCCDCAEEISSKRIALNPSVTRCTECQIKLEKKRKY